VLLFSQFAIYRLRALLVLACGYLFSALMIIPHALTFPGAFSPTGLLGAGLQTTALLYWFWHLLFPLALLGYGLMKDEKSDPGPGQPSLLAVIILSVALVLALVCGLTLLATAGNDYLPVLFANRIDFTPAARLAAATTMLMSVSAVAVLWVRRRSLLDQWLDDRRSGGTSGNGTRRHIRQWALQPRVLCRPPVFAAHLDDRPGRSAGGDDAVSRQRRPFQGKEDPPPSRCQYSGDLHFESGRRNYRS
jgi:hypothetical protein